MTLVCSFLLYGGWGGGLNQMIFLFLFVGAVVFFLQ